MKLDSKEKDGIKYYKMCITTICMGKVSHGLSVNQCTWWQMLGLLIWSMVEILASFELLMVNHEAVMDVA
jgi:hypothetical protein